MNRIKVLTFVDGQIGEFGFFSYEAGAALADAVLLKNKPEQWEIRFLDDGEYSPIMFFALLDKTLGDVDGWLRSRDLLDFSILTIEDLADAISPHEPV